MNKKFITTGFVLFSLSLPLSAQASSFNYSQLVVFGDSLSDTGNVFTLTGNTFPPASFGYVNGRFTNGLNWIDYLAQDLGVASPTPIFDILLNSASPTTGINVAVGGATTESANTVTSLLPGLQGLTGQISLFSSVSSFVDPNALYTFWYGANDYLPTTSLDFTPFITPDQTVSNMANAISSLVGLGAKNILIPNLPLLGNVPRANNFDPSFPLVAIDTADNLNFLSQQHNQLLDTTINTLSNNFGSGINLISLDIATLFDGLINQFNNNPTQSPFTNVTNPCLFTQTCTNPDQFLFWDGIHPSTKTHQIIGQFAIETLEKDAQSVPESSNLWGILGLGLIGTTATLKRLIEK
jgi:phospholipase/lecithinase/hemolysin